MSPGGTLYTIGFPTIFKRKSSIKQTLVELSRKAEYAEFLSMFVFFEFCAYFIVFLLSVQLKKITFQVKESRRALFVTKGFLWKTAKTIVKNCKNQPNPRPYFLTDLQILALRNYNSFME